MADADQGLPQALNWLQAKLLEFDVESVVIQRPEFHAYLISERITVKSTIDLCIGLGWLEDAPFVTTIVFHSDYGMPSRQELPASPGYRITERVKSATVSDRGTETRRIQPDNPDVRDLCALLAKRLKPGKTQAEIAREFTQESVGNDPKAQSLLRQARRFRHLWADTDT